MVAAAMEGKQCPEVTFKVFEKGTFVDVNTSDILRNKKVVIFSLPGAFTPTCSNSHLPRYDELYNTMLKTGKVDDVYCLSVNDSFVMNAWADAHKLKYVKMLPDGNGDFSKAMSLLVDKSAIGFGHRSVRFI